MRILGIDPGSRLTGYGCVDVVGSRIALVTHGTLKVANLSSSEEMTPFEDRLLAIYEGLSQVIQEFKPQAMVVEKVFFAKNALSALKLGQARGAVVLTGKIHALKIFEYSPTEVKYGITGHGRADKEQVAKMLQLIIGPQKFSTWDASDGLALAICHAQLMRSVDPIRAALNLDLQGASGRSTKRRYSLAESVGMGVRKKG